MLSTLISIYISKNIKRYLRVFIKKQAIILIIIGIAIGYLNIKIKNKTYEDFNKIEKENNNIIGVVLDYKETEYGYTYTIKGKTKGFSNKKILVYTSKNCKLDIGDLAKFNLELQKISERRNYKGFNYKEYLKTKGIYGIAKSNKIEVIGKNKVNIIYRFSINIREKIKNKIYSNLPKNSAGLLAALVVGDKSNIEEEVINNFKANNLSHILAISGMHISYIIILINYILVKLKVPKKFVSITISVILIIFIIITNFSPSVIRASIMGIIVLVSKSFYYKADFWTCIAISVLVTTFINPFYILDMGFKLSYIGTISIVVFSKTIIKLENKKTLKEKIKELAILTICAQILLIPITILNFHTISTYFIFSNILVSPIVSIVIMLGFITIGTSFISIGISKALFYILNIFLKLLNFIPEVLSKFPFSKIYITNMNYISFVLYYIAILIAYVWTINKNKIKKGLLLRRYERKLLKSKTYKNAIIVVIVIFIFVNISVNIFNLLDRKLNIYFIDVGQGDSTLIVTPNKHTILIDGGDFEKDILLEYLLDRNINRINFIIISHFDSDHIGGLFEVMNELKIDKVIIPIGMETSENYGRFKEIIGNKRIKTILVGGGSISTQESSNRLYIEKDLYIDFLWPNNKKLISENILNNNSIVCKLNYKECSMLFTGDIEEIAEKEILQEYKNNLSILNSGILKAAHHGSKTSSTKEFLEAVKPKMVLIGVGENNKFGHPNAEVTNRFENLRNKNI